MKNIYLILSNSIKLSLFSISGNQMKKKGVQQQDTDAVRVYLQGSMR